MYHSYDLLPFVAPFTLQWDPAIPLRQAGSDKGDYLGRAQTLDSVLTISCHFVGRLHIIEVGDLQYGGRTTLLTVRSAQ